jgi:hypothetical protein
VPDRNLVGTHVACEPLKSKAAPEAPPKVDDKAVTAFRNEIVDRGVEGLAEPHPKCAGEVRHFQQPDTGRCG